MAVVLLLCCALFGVHYWVAKQTAAPVLPVVDVRGDVPRPGYHEAATIHDALRAAGLEPAQHIDAPLRTGTALVVEGQEVRLSRMTDTLVIGLPIDVNAASVETLLAIPGLGPSKAAAIVAHRNEHGPFERIEQLDDVHGIGPATVDKLRPFVITAAP